MLPNVQNSCEVLTVEMTPGLLIGLLHLCAQKLLKQGADPNCVDREGESLLHLSIIFGRKDVTAFLLVAGNYLSLTHAVFLSPSCLNVR